MVSTLDSESSDPSSNLGGTFAFTFFFFFFFTQCFLQYRPNPNDKRVHSRTLVGISFYLFIFCHYKMLSERRIEFWCREHLWGKTMYYLYGGPCENKLKPRLNKPLSLYKEVLGITNDIHRHVLRVFSWSHFMGCMRVLLARQVDKRKLNNNKLV